MLFKKINNLPLNHHKHVFTKPLLFLWLEASSNKLLKLFRYLKSYESHLANIALSNVESSRTIAQILYDINDGTTHR